MADGGEIVIGVVGRASLSATLTAIHRGGFGNVSRVLDPKRGEATGQLRRAGVDVPIDFAIEGDERVAIMITASARAAVATELLRRHGAVSTWTVVRNGPATPLLFDDLAARSRSRRVATPELLAD
jgi:hypothetical protein